MTRQRPGGGIKIGQQNAGQIVNVAGDQTVYGGMVGSFKGDVAQNLADVELIERLLDEVALTGSQRRAAAEAVAGAKAELGKPEPRPATVADRLRDLTGVLTAAGALAGAGLGIVDPIVRIATGLGAAGLEVLRLLGR